MNKLFTSAGMIALGVSTVNAATGPSLTAIERSKPWTVSAALRGFYDDNYTTSPNRFKRSSFGFEVSPSASLNLALDPTFIGASYEYSLRYYEDRKRNNFDQTHKFDLRLDHAFSERYKIEFNDSFVIAQEPEVIAPTGGPTSTPLRTEGDNIRNWASVNFIAELTEILGLEVGYANTFYDYQEENGTVASPSRSALLDRDEHLATLNLRWRLLPETVGILGYKFGVVNYSSDEAIGIAPDGTVVHSDIRDSRSHYLYVGADHQFNSQLSGSIRVGAQYFDFYNQDQSSVSPYADASLTYQYARASYVQAGVSHTRARTDVATVSGANDVTSDQEVTAVYASINHKITPNLLGSLLLQGQRGTFTGGFADGDTEYFFIGGLNFSYTINPHLLAEAGYNFDYLDSDQAGRNYTRNRVYVGIRATY
ncbi:MAG: outer membrane beta-barrel protein [Verrucomicrobiota bacterium]